MEERHPSTGSATNRNLRWIVLGLAWLAFGPLSAAALTEPPALESLEENDREALERIAVQPPSLREAALVATQHVDTLVEVQRIQEQSSTDFQERIADLDRETQEQLWEIVREPGLLIEMAGRGPRSAAQLDEIAAARPDALASAIRTVGAEHPQLLGHVFSIQERANERFALLLRDLPDDASREAFRDLLAEPELLSLLARRVNLVVRLGDSFREDPATTRAHLAALGEEVAASEALAREQWAKSIADDPEAAEELEASARAYADEYGYDYDELTEPEVRTRIHVTVNPYPFWFGYPYWYADAYLFPYGYWYHYPPHFGFYHHHRHRSYVWFGLPSVHFAHWFFGGHHYRHYGHLSHGFDRHYRRHYRGGSVFHHTLRNWVHWRDRDHHHRGRHQRRYDGGRSHARHGGGGGDSFFVSLYERARFERDGSRRGGGFRERGDRDGRDRDRVGRDGRSGRGDGVVRDGRDGRRGGDGDARRGDRREGRDDARANRDRNRDRDDARANRGRDGERASRDRNRDRDGERANRGRGRDGERANRSSSRGQVGERASRGSDRGERANRSRDRNPPSLGRSDRRGGDGPRIRIRDHRSDTRANRGNSSVQRRERAPRPQRERGFSSRGGDRGPSVSHRGGGSRGRSDMNRGGGSRGRSHVGRGGGGGGGRHRGGGPSQRGGGRGRR